MIKQDDGKLDVMSVPGDIVDALMCVRNVFEQAIASGKHKPGDWRALGVEGNWDHLHDHLHLAVLSDEKEDHLANLCCRALILLQLREESRREAQSKR